MMNNSILGQKVKSESYKMDIHVIIGSKSDSLVNLGVNDQKVKVIFDEKWLTFTQKERVCCLEVLK
jgi:hypothetical protein